MIRILALQKLKTNLTLGKSDHISLRSVLPGHGSCYCPHNN